MAQISFHVVINEEDDGTYWASVEELPGCFASGATIDELKEAAVEAMQMWLPDGIKMGDPRWQAIAGLKQPRNGSKEPARPQQQMLVYA